MKDGTYISIYPPSQGLGRKNNFGKTYYEKTPLKALWVSCQGESHNCFDDTCLVKLAGHPFKTHIDTHYTLWTSSLCVQHTEMPPGQLATLAMALHVNSINKLSISSRKKSFKYYQILPVNHPTKRWVSSLPLAFYWHSLADLLYRLDDWHTAPTLRPELALHLPNINKAAYLRFQNSTKLEINDKVINKKHQPNLWVW